MAKNIIVNGLLEGSDFADYENELENNLSDDDQYFKLRDMTINYCQGCWDCWVKTPGVCIFKDDYLKILTKIPMADSLTIVTPIIAGYESSLIKKFKDRIIPIGHPYIKLYKGEQHHHQRYEKVPVFNVIVLEDEATTSEDIEIIKELYERVVLNFSSKLNRFQSIKKGCVE